MLVLCGEGLAASLKTLTTGYHLFFTVCKFSLNIFTATSYMVIPYIQNPRTCHVMVAWNSFNNVTRSTTSNKYISVAESRHPCHTLNGLKFWNIKLMSLVLWNKELLWELRPSQWCYWRSKTSGMLCHTDY
jgi:hypothetical protein